MKKMLLSVVFLASSLMIFANSKIVLTSGSLDFLKEAGEYAYCELDWSNTQVVEFDTDLTIEKEFGTIDQYNQMQGQDWVDDWDELRMSIDLMLPVMKGGKYSFNKRNKKGLQFTINPEWYAVYSEIEDVARQKEMAKSVTIVDPATAKYKVIVHADMVDMGSGAAAVFGGIYAGGAIMKGKMEVINLQDNSTVATMDINYVKGIGSITQFARLGLLLSEIFAIELIDMLKK